MPPRERGVDSAAHAEEMIDAYVADTEPARTRPPRPRAEGDRDDRRDRLADRGADRARTRLRVQRRRLLQGSQLRTLRAALEPRPRLDGSGRGGRQPPSSRRTRSTSRSGRRARTAEDTLLAEPLGRRPAGLAHRVLGDGRGAARQSSSRSTAAAPTSSFPTTRTRSPRPRRPAGVPLAQDLDAQRNGRDRLGEDVEVGRQHLSAGRGARSPTAPRPSSPSSLGGHYRQPIAFDDEALVEAGARNERIRDFLLSQRTEGGEEERRQRGPGGVPVEALADDFNTPARPRRAVLADRRRQPGAAGRSPRAGRGAACRCWASRR